ncbi:hypothetical protein [Cryobacterium sp. Y62]|uniref:hypothetical protein n=1 Tax=Cryobacterium sp. Y62 TaxID=2048284 RepID=UPI000CE4D6C3|nr:hypothetical protein [Cryobacterium sp. Y62]
MTHILSTRRRLATPPELPESNRTGVLRSASGLAWLLGRAQRQPETSTPTELAVARTRSEVAVDNLLATLPEHWAAFTSPAETRDGPSAARLIVGPGGVFALHAQLCDGRTAWVYRRTVHVGGRRSPDLAIAEAGAQRLTTLLRGRVPLRTAVQPVVVVLGARSLWATGRTQPGRTLQSWAVPGRTAPVAVLGAGALNEWLAARPQVLRPIERMELAAAIDNPLTWGIRPSILPRPGTARD